MKKKIILPICYVLGFILIAFGTYAFLTSTASKNNSFTIGGNTIEIIEDFIPPESIKAGIEFKKDIKVKNTGASNCYVRLKVVFSDSDMEKFCTFTDLNTSDWIYNSSDNYYYYKQPIKNNELTTSLFTTVAISDTLEIYQAKPFDIFVYAESMQANPFENYEEAWATFEQQKTN